MGQIPMKLAIISDNLRIFAGEPRINKDGSNSVPWGNEYVGTRPMTVPKEDSVLYMHNGSVFLRGSVPHSFSSGHHSEVFTTVLVDDHTFLEWTVLDGTIALNSASLFL